MALWVMGPEDEGFEAYRAGALVIECPYHPSTDEAERWRSGWEIGKDKLGRTALSEFDKNEWFDVARLMKPGLTEGEYEAMWQRWLVASANRDLN